MDCKDCDNYREMGEEFPDCALMKCPKEIRRQTIIEIKDLITDCDLEYEDRRDLLDEIRILERAEK